MMQQSLFISNEMNMKMYLETFKIIKFINMIIYNDIIIRWYITIKEFIL